MYSGSGEAVRSIKEFGFRHGLLFIPPGARAGFIYEKYQILADFTGLAKEWGPYNLLVTRGWMMLIPRMQERYEGISINSLGFAGSILVKDPLEFELIEQAGLFKILSSVGLPLK
jgi:ATP adenylyltransferase